MYCHLAVKFEIRNRAFIEQFLSLGEFIPFSVVDVGTLVILRIHIAQQLPYPALLHVHQETELVGSISTSSLFIGSNPYFGIADIVFSLTEEANIFTRLRN